jgi:thiol-disulfide isomerase/thioredoxin
MACLRAPVRDEPTTKRLSAPWRTRSVGGMRTVTAVVTLLLSAWGPQPTQAFVPIDSLDALNIPLLDPPVPAPAVVMWTLDGHRLGLEDLRGRVVLLNFWATWCVPCREEMPAFQRLHADYHARGLSVLAVNYRQSRGNAEEFAHELRLSFAIALDEDGAVARRFAVRGLPVTFLIDRDGRILWKAIGERAWDSGPGRQIFEHLLPRGRL